MAGVLAGGPGWVVLGVLKMLGGALLAWRAALAQRQLALFALVAIAAAALEVFTLHLLAPLENRLL